MERSNYGMSFGRRPAVRDRPHRTDKTSVPVADEEHFDAARVDVEDVVVDDRTQMVVRSIAVAVGTQIQYEAVELPESQTYSDQ